MPTFGVLIGRDDTSDTRPSMLPAGATVPVITFAFRHLKLPTVVALILCQITAASAQHSDAAVPVPQDELSAGDVESPNVAAELPSAEAIVESTEAEAGNEPLTVDAAVRIAFANHPDLQSAAAVVRREQHLICQVTRSPNPTVGYLASEVGNDGDAGQQGVFLSQNIVRGGKLYLNGQVQQRKVSVAHQQLELRRLQLEADVRTSFLEVAVAQERRKLLLRLQTPLDNAERSAQRLLQSGIISGPSSAQSRLEAQKNRMQIRRTETQLTYASARLAALIGIPGDIESVRATALLPDNELPDMEQLSQRIQSLSPEVSLAASRYDRSHWQVRREIAEPVPDLQTQWSLQQDASTNHTVVGIQLGVTLPVRNDNSGAINAARADTWRTHHDLQAVQRSLQQRLAAAYGTVQQADGQLEVINNELEALARETLQKTQQAFSLGEATYLDLLNAQRAYISLSLDTLDLYRQRAQAVVHLDTMLVRAEVR